MSRRIAPKLSFTRKSLLIVTGVVALAVPLVVGMLNVPILRAQSQRRPQPQSQPIPQPQSQPQASPSQAQAQLQQQPQSQLKSQPRPLGVAVAVAPEGLLTGLEGQRHDRFIDRARAGNIDIVFFGSTETEMWLWRDRGLSVWDRTFGALKAADFGTQGTRFASLLWRMQNGELDGYQAKVVVLQAFGTGDDAISGANYAAIIAEVRARQPQAKILIFAAFPRGRLRREPWRRIAEANAATVAALADDKTVFYIDIGDRFFRPDGSHNQEMWTISPNAAGIHEPAFQVWAEELQPWLDRFVR